METEQSNAGPHPSAKVLIRDDHLVMTGWPYAARKVVITL